MKAQVQRKEVALKQEDQRFAPSFEINQINMSKQEQTEPQREMTLNS